MPIDNPNKNKICVCICVEWAEKIIDKKSISCYFTFVGGNLIS